MVYEKEVAIAGLVVIEVVALCHGYNSALTGAVCAIIGGIAGYKLKGHKGS